MIQSDGPFRKIQRCTGGQTIKPLTTQHCNIASTHRETSGVVHRSIPDIDLVLKYRQLKMSNKKQAQSARAKLCQPIVKFSRSTLLGQYTLSAFLSPSTHLSVPSNSKQKPPKRNTKKNQFLLIIYNHRCPHTPVWGGREAKLQGCSQYLTNKNSSLCVFFT